MEVMSPKKHVPNKSAIVLAGGSAQVNPSASIRGQFVMVRPIAKQEEMKARTCAPRSFATVPF